MRFHLFHQWKPVAVLNFAQKLYDPDTPGGPALNGEGTGHTHILRRCQRAGCVAVQVETIKGYWTIEEIAGGEDVLSQVVK